MGEMLRVLRGAQGAPRQSPTWSGRTQTAALPTPRLQPLWQQGLHSGCSLEMCILVQMQLELQS